jgi:hypothetical protein
MKIVVLALLLTIVACSQPALFDKSNKIKLENLRCAVMPIVNARINIPDGIQREFGIGNRDTLLIAYMQKALTKKLQTKACFDSVFSCKFSRQPSFVYDSVKNKSVTATIVRPNADSSLFACNNDVVLMVYNVYIDTVTLECVFQDVTVSTTTLQLNGEYVFWNTQRKGLLAYGTVKTDYSTAGQAIHVQNWDKLMSNLANKLLDNCRK